MIVLLSTACSKFVDYNPHEDFQITADDFLNYQEPPKYSPSYDATTTSTSLKKKRQVEHHFPTTSQTAAQMHSTNTQTLLEHKPQTGHFYVDEEMNDIFLTTLNSKCEAMEESLAGQNDAIQATLTTVTSNMDELRTMVQTLIQITN